MDFVWLFFISLVVFIVFQIAFIKIGQSRMIKLSELLYINKDADGYLAKLNAPLSKLYFPPSTRLMMEVDAYILNNNQHELQRVIELIEKSKNRFPKDRSLYLQKVLIHAIDKHHDELAIKMMTLVEEHFQNGGFKDHEQTYQECKAYYEIYLNEDIAAAQCLLDIADTKEGIVKGLYYFRVAKGYAFLNQKDQAIDILKQAQELLKETEWQGIIQKAIEDPKHLLD